MKIRVWRRWLGVGAVIVVMGLAAISSLRIVEQNRRDAMYLAEVDLPLFDQLMQWRAAVSRLESQLYSFYVTADHRKFLNTYHPELARVEKEMVAIAQQIPEAPVLQNLREDLRQWHLLSEQFERVMTDEEIDWDQARQVMAEFTPLAARVGEHNITLTQWIRTRVNARSSATLQRTESMLIVAFAFTAIAAIAAVVLAWLNGRRLHALYEQRRLSSYPQRNPHSVLALSEQGELRYANPSAIALSQQLGLGETASSLLPDDMTVAMSELRKRGGGVKQSEFERHGRHFQLMLHWLPDFAEFRVYLSDITERKMAENRLRDLAYHDAITGLPNRASFQDYFLSLVKAGQFANKMLSLCVLDRFQQAISRAGHAVADEVMRAAALRLHNSLLARLSEAEPRLFRFEGNLFCIVLNHSVENIDQLNNVIADMSTSLVVHELEFYLSLSIGATPLVGAGTELNLILRQADSALQSVKLSGGHALRCYDAALDKQYLRTLQVEDALRQAVERREFFLVYQPQIELHNGRVCGVETLLRWQHPELGMVSPAEFIPIAESSALIVSIGEWVLREAIIQALQWQQLGLHFVVAVNVSARQWMQADLVSLISTLLAELQFEAKWLELEITESAALSDFEATIKTMNGLRALGVNLSIDDFGTGYSSLSYLHRLPVDKLKIDQSFVRQIGLGNADESVTQTIITLARGLGMKVIAEGVETVHQAALLAKWTCDEGQGYLIAKPLPAVSLVNWINEHSTMEWQSTLYAAHDSTSDPVSELM